MIHVDRPPGSRPAVLERKDRQGRTERDRAIAFFQPRKRKSVGSKKRRASKKKARGFEFKVYREVRAELEELFHCKCAYCEHDYSAGQPGDVEHYRPKGAVDDGGKRQAPGYYWLASEWSNLLPSCADCNRMRGHEAADGEERLKLGKANQFPVAGRRVSAPVDDVETLDEMERPLLLHPCRDRPEEHLSFDEEGLVTDLSPQGKVSVEVLGLARPRLVRARKKLAVSLLEQLEELAERLEDYNDDPSERNRRRFETKLKRINRLGLATEPYSAMCSQILACRKPEILGSFGVRSPERQPGAVAAAATP